MGADWGRWRVTAAEARQELKRKLVFGDALQIKALAILEKVAECKEAIAACENKDEHISCGYLDARDCDCNYHYDDEIVKAALAELKYEKRKL